MAESIVEIPASALPPMEEGAPLLTKLDGVRNGIARLVISTTVTSSRGNKKGLMESLLKSLDVLPRKNTITPEDREDHRYIDLLKKHAPDYLAEHAPDLLD